MIKATHTVMLATIPVDTFLEILRYVSLQDLCALSVCCKGFLPSCRDGIYGAIWHPNAVEAFPVLLGDRSLAERVGFLDLSDARWRPDDARKRGYLSLIAQTLPCLRNLRHLKLRILCKGSWVLNGCRDAFRLSSFEVDFYTDEDLLAFLDHQCEIEDLTFVHSLPPYLTVRSTSLPRLARLNAAASWVDSLLPGRRVARIHFTSPPVRALDVLVRTTCSVEMVRLPYNYVRTTPPATLCLWLRGVREFWIDSVYMFDDDVEQCLHYLVSSLASLQHLFLVVTSMYINRDLESSITKMTIDAPQFERFTVIYRSGDIRRFYYQMTGDSDVVISWVRNEDGSWHKVL